MKKTILIIIASQLLLVASLVMADGRQNIEIEDSYIQIGVGGAVVSDELYTEIRISGGVGLSKSVGIDVGLATTIGVFNNIDFLYLSLASNYAIGEKDSITGKFGIVKWDSEISSPFSSANTQEDGVNILLGIEFMLGLYENVSITLSLDYYGSVRTDNGGGEEIIIPASLGLKYSF